MFLNLILGILKQKEVHFLLRHTEVSTCGLKPQVTLTNASISKGTLNTRFRATQFGLSFEYINSNFLCVGGLTRRILFNQKLENVPELPPMLYPTSKTKLPKDFPSINKTIPKGERFETLKAMALSGVVNCKEVLQFVHEYYCQGEILDQQLNYLLSLIKNIDPDLKLDNLLFLFVYSYL